MAALEHGQGNRFGTSNHMIIERFLAFDTVDHDPSSQARTLADVIASCPEIAGVNDYYGMQGNDEGMPETALPMDKADRYQSMAQASTGQDVTVMLGIE